MLFFLLLESDQMLDTDNLKSKRVLLETPNLSGQVAQQSYEQNVGEMSQYYKLLDALNHTVINVHHRLNGEFPLCFCVW